MRSISSEFRTSPDNATVRSGQPIRIRAASARPASRDSMTTLAPCATKILVRASPIPIDAPVTTTTFPSSSMPGLYPPRHGKSRLRSDVLQSMSYNQTAAPILRAHDIGDFVALLPLFPLELVLLPGTPLPLHIFEPRYKEMIRECISTEAPFGVVRAFEEGIAEVGCTAEIITVTKEYPDGRMDLICEGRKRFEVIEVNRDRSFLQADVLIVPDDPEAAAQEERVKAVQLHLEILSLAGAVQDLSAADQNQLSFYLAGSLPLDLDFKQKLLAMRSEAQRIQAVAAYLETILPQLKRAARARQTAGGNGHVH